MASAELDRFRFCVCGPDEANDSADVANLSAFRERLMLAARPRKVYSADSFSSDANSIDWEFGKAEAADAGTAEVGVGLLAIASGWCDWTPASFCAAVAFIIAGLTTAPRAETPVGG